MELMGNYLTIQTPEGLMDVYTASLDRSEKLPVVIVLQEAFGVNHHIKDVCHRLARAGFYAMAPELYHRQGRHVIVEYGDRKDFLPLLGSLTNAGIVSDVLSTIDFLGQLPLADAGRVSTLGFCVGGFSSVLAGMNFSLRGMISFYGAGLSHSREGIALTPVFSDLGKLRCRSLFFFGGKDASIPPREVEAIREKLRAEKVPHDAIVFETSDHGFFCDERKAYDQSAAAEAWKITLEFLKQVNLFQRA